MVVLAHKRSSATMRQGDSLVSEQKQCGVNATTEIWSAVTYHRFPESFRGLSPKQAASNGPEKTWDAFWPSTATSRLPKAVTSHRTPNLCRSLAHFAKCAACAKSRHWSTARRSTTSFLARSERELGNDSACPARTGIRAALRTL